MKIFNKIFEMRKKFCFSDRFNMNLSVDLCFVAVLSVFMSIGPEIYKKYLKIMQSGRLSTTHNILIAVVWTTKAAIAQQVKLWCQHKSTVKADVYFGETIRASNIF
jgi:hypothetical protein